MKKICRIILALTMGLSIIACGPEEKLPNPGEAPETPVDPDKPDPDKPDPEKPDPENPDKPGDTIYYEEVTAALDDWTGTYLIAAEHSDKSVKVLGKWHESDYALPADNVDLSSLAENGYIAADKVDQYAAFFVKTGDGYTARIPKFGYMGLYSGGKRLQLSDSPTQKGFQWILSWSGDHVSMKNAGYEDYSLQWNHSSPRFACYASGQTAIRLYKRSAALEETDPDTPVDPDPDKPADLYMNVGQKEFSVKAEAGNVTMKVFSNVSWTLTASDGLVAEPASGEGNATVKFSYQANGSESPRSLTAVLSTEAAVKDKSLDIKINQEGVWNPSSDQGDWTRLKYIEDLYAGAEIRMAISSKQVALGASDDANGYFESVPAAIEGQKVKAPGATSFVVGGIEGAWTLSASGKTLYAEGQKTLILSDQATSWRIKVEEDGTADIRCNYGCIMYNAGSPRFNVYQTNPSSQMLKVEIYMKDYDPDADGRRPQVDFGALTISDISAQGANLSQIYSAATSVPQKAGFQYSLTENSFNDHVEAYGAVAIDGTFAGHIENLSSDATYYVRPYVKLYGTGAYASREATIYGPVKSFKTLSSGGSNPDPNPDPDQPGGGENPGGNPVLNGTGWLELPGVSAKDGLVGTYYAGGNRNYTYNYDTGMYTAMWIAYPLYESAMNGGGRGSWKDSPNIPKDKQINIWSGSYGVEDYSRGHQIANSDRSKEKSMQAQTFYSVNSTPQIQNGFNGTIWNFLEQAVRGSVSSDKDTVYVITGPAFKTVGNDEPIKIIHAKNDVKKDCPVPNYYWKALLKVKRSGNKITSAKAVGFWFVHKVYPSKEPYKNYVCTIDEIEAKTGYDLFANLPDDIESLVETQDDWNAFESF